MPTMQSYPPDPGNVFASDHHRRVAAHLPQEDAEGIDVENLFYRVLQTEGPGFLDADQLQGILDEMLDEDVQAEGGLYRLTSVGYEHLTGPALVSHEVKDENGEIVTVFEEDPPKEGKDLQRAEEINEERAEKDREIEKTNKEERKAQLEKELAELEEE